MMEQSDITYIEGLRAQAKDFTMVAFYDNLLMKMQSALLQQQIDDNFDNLDRMAVLLRGYHGQTY